MITQGQRFTFEGGHSVEISVTVNGEQHRHDVEPRPQLRERPGDARGTEIDDGERWGVARVDVLLVRRPQAVVRERGLCLGDDRVNRLADAVRVPGFGRQRLVLAWPVEDRRLGAHSDATLVH